MCCLMNTFSKALFFARLKLILYSALQVNFVRELQCLEENSASELKFSFQALLEIIYS